MSRKILKTNDLITVFIGYKNGVGFSYYCRVVGIISNKNGKVYNKLEIVTGEGDLNSDVLIKSKILAQGNLDKVNFENFTTSTIDYLKKKFLYNGDDKTISVDPHKAHIINIKKEIKFLNKEVNSLQDKIKFLNKNSRRNFMIKEILD